MDTGTLFMLIWLAVKFVVDAISITFIFWRLVHHSQRNGGGRHGGDFYFLVWIALKFPVDIVFIILYCLTIWEKIV